LQDSLEIVLRRRWYLIIAFVLSVTMSVVLCFVLPKMYRSTTLILVEQQKVPEDYVKSSVSVGIDERLNTIQQQIMSRSLLQSVIDEFGLYKKESERKTPEEVVDLMRKHILVDVVRGGRNIDGFSISYEGADPKTVMLVTNKLAALFIQANLKEREEFVQATSAFLDTELNGVRANLVAQETKIREFKQKYMGELPEQIMTNLRTLDRLQLEQQTVHEALSKDKELRAAMLEKNSKLVTLTPNQVMTEAVKDINPVQLRLNQLRADLADLRTRYTDKFPDVIRVKTEIEDLEQRLKADGSPTEGPRNGKTKKIGPNKETGLADATLTNDLQTQYNQMDVEILRLEAKQKQISEQMKEYEDRVEKAPLHEQQMLSLMRDYEITKQNYQSLLDKKLNAKISENLEERQKGEQFRVLDPADLPKKPFKPDQFKLILLGIIAGLGGGGGLAYLREMTDVSFKKAEDVETILRFPVLASIPNIGKSLKRERKLA
jgi:polysaccharide chain length determinant protein (PEP-CTERM system associated)